MQIPNLHWCPSWRMGTILPPSLLYKCILTSVLYMFFVFFNSIYLKAHLTFAMLH